MKKTITAFALCAATAVAITGCTNSSETNMSSSQGQTTTAAEAASESATTDAVEGQAAHLVLVDGYCKAKPADDAAAHEGMDHEGMDHEGMDHGSAGMTACFGELKNAGDTAVTVTEWTSISLEGARFEIHEVVDGKMQKKESLTIEPGGTAKLVPGGDHLMALDLPGEVAAGDQVTVTVKCEDGSELTTDVPVQEQPAGKEEYDG
ncbi:copper chaperone PCu(A)C [Corynebacterium aquatimens]|uniref:Copper(I)-binding protein n=1 Tax=Corynebacterium aquatimens TaxID=1190508 RepID=A0A931GRZ6_9CORY|nr:copper chaperone PCu(A)C [Corynebacterium aquatimens]MBG6122518.1 copper(I)-binding protein [Corynebacterium aquatimens]WJY64942.1 hypothetical protein CAQUA_01010 [Corynebacterium aquatimens]